MPVPSPRSGLKTYLVGFLFAALAPGLPAPARAVSNTVVISQLYAGGGEPGAAHQRDYVVLFNSGVAPVDLSSWSLQVSTFGPTGPTWEVLPLCGSIPHGRFYLVALGSSGPEGAPLPASECAGVVNLAGSNGAVALVSGLAPLPAPCPPASDPQIVDLLGYGSAAPCFEGTAASGLHSGIALSRPAAAPCLDTDSNSADFAVIVPSPQNGSDSNGCNNTPPTVDPIADVTLLEGDVLRFTVAATDPDSDPVAYGGTGPSWFSVDPTTGLCTIAPGYDASGLGVGSFPAAVTATDGIETGSQTFTIHVLNATTGANTPFAARTWHGVNLPTCELSFAEEPDLCLGGPMRLCFGRHYASLLEREGMSLGSFGGGNWRGTYDWRFTETAGEARVVSAMGAVYRFTVSRGAFVLEEPQELPYELTNLGGEAAFTHPGDRLFYVFERATGLLTRIEDGQGNVHTLAYSGTQLSTVTDGLGRTLSFTQDGSGRLIAVSDGTRTATYGYTGANLTSFTDAAAKTTSYSYDLAHAIPGLLTTRQDPAGNVPLQYAYDALGRVHLVQDAGGGSVPLQVVVTGTAVQTEVTLQDGGTHRYEHDAFGRLALYTEPSSGAHAFTYDLQGRPVSITRPSGIQPETYAYDPAGGFPSVVTLADGSQWQHSYVSRSYTAGRFWFVSMTQAPDLTQVQYGYDLVGNLIQITDQASHVWTISYNGFGQPVLITNPAGGTTAFDYDIRGRVIGRTVEAYAPTSYGYDALDRIVLVTLPDLSTRGFTWDTRDRLLSFTNELGKTWTLEYRDNGQLLRVRNPLLAATEYAYDQMDRLTQVRDAMGGASSYTYDAAWRPASALDPTSRGSSLQYNTLGQVIACREEPTGQQTSYAYDADGRLLSSTDPLTHTEGFGWDNRDRLTGYTDPLGNATSYGYDAVGRLTTVNAPEGMAHAYTYDSRGLLASTTVGPVHFEYSHNALRALTTFRDGNNENWSFGRDPIGRITSVTDPLLRTVSFAHDARNRMTGMTSTEGTASYTYDTAGRLTRRSFSDGTLHTYAYDDVGRLLSTEGMTRTYDALGRVASENGIGYGYDAAGRLVTETLATGKIVTHGYDARGLPSLTQDWLGGTTTYAHDDDGLPIGTTLPNGILVVRGYDASHRLNRGTHKKTFSDSAGTFTLTLDGLGRVESAERRMPLSWAPDVGLRSYAYDAASQIVGFTYDGLGRLVSDGVRTYDWDLALRLRNFTEGAATASYTYDGLDRVIQATPLAGTSVEMVQGNPGGGKRGNPELANPELANPDISNPGISNPDHSVLDEPTFSEMSKMDPSAGPPHAAPILRNPTLPDVPVPLPIPKLDDRRFGNLVGPSGASGLVAILSPGDEGGTAHEGGMNQFTHRLPSRPGRASRIHVIRDIGTDIAYMVRAPGGELLYTLEAAGGSWAPRYFHYDEQGNTSFLTDADGSVVTSFAYSESGEPTMLGASPGYPAFTFHGAMDATQESPSGLYRIGAGVYDAKTAQTSRRYLYFAKVASHGFLPFHRVAWFPTSNPGTDYRERYYITGPAHIALPTVPTKAPVSDTKMSAIRNMKS